MKTLIINNHSKHLSEIEKLFPNSQIISHEDISPDQDLNGFELLIISGGSGVPTVLHHRDYYAIEERIVAKSSIPILGICLGAEVIVTTFGGELTEISTLHRGEIELIITDESLYKAVDTNKIEVYEAHSVRIRQLPVDFTACAHSDHGIEIFKHITKPIIGIQFHPEVGKHADLWGWILKTLQVKN